MKSINNYKVLFDKAGDVKVIGKKISHNDSRVLNFKSIKAYNTASKISKYKVDAILHYFNNVHPKLKNVQELIIDRDVFAYRSGYYICIQSYDMVKYLTKPEPLYTDVNMSEILKGTSRVKLSNDSEIMIFPQELEYKNLGQSMSDAENVDYIIRSKDVTHKGMGKLVKLGDLECCKDVVHLGNDTFRLILGDKEELDIDLNNGVFVVRDLETKHVKSLCADKLYRDKRESIISVYVDEKPCISLDISKVTKDFLENLLLTIYYNSRSVLIK